jgi:excisionase family DNA binding protein
MNALQEEIRAVIEPLVVELAQLRAVINTHVNADTGIKLVTVREAAQRLGCGEETVRRMVKSGRLKCKRIGNQIRIDPADLI